jgi:hypothetical protein
VHEKDPGACPGPASLSGWECLHKSGGGGAEFLDGDLLFCAEPIFLVVAVLAASFLVEFVGAFSDLLLEFDVLWIACYGRWLFVWGLVINGGDSF